MIRRLLIAFLFVGAPALARASNSQFPSVANRAVLAATTIPGAPASGWLSIGVFASSFTKTSNDPWDITTTNTLEAGNVGVCIGAVDNDGNGTDTDDFNTTADSGGNNWTSSGENEVDPGAASAGAAVQIQWVLAAAQVTAGGTVQLNFPAARNSKAINCWEFDISGTGVTFVGAEQKEDATATDAGALTVGSLSAGEHLCVRAVASETGLTETITQTSGWTPFGDVGTTGSTDNTNMRVWGEWKVFTGTSSGASDPLFSAPSIDRASSMICLDQS